MRISTYSNFILATLVLIFVVPVYAQNPTAVGSGKVLLLHSYHTGYKWTDDITLAVSDSLTKGNNHKLYIEYLDSRRHRSQSYLDEQLRFLKKKYKEISFDAILVADNNALHYSLTHRELLFPEVPIVFCGVNSFKEWMLRGQQNITGVNEEVDIRKTIDLMLLLHPETKKIIVINDETKTGEIIRNEALRVSNSYTDIQWYMPAILTFEELNSEISSLGKGDLLLLGTFSKDFDGEYIEISKLAKLVTENVQIPTYGLWDFYLGKGIVGGYLASATQQGRRAAEIVLEILGGKKADEIPVVMKSPNHYLIDYQVMQRFQITSELLPAETTYINQPPDFYSSYKETIWVVLSALVILVLLSTSLLLAVIRKNRAEKGLRELTTELSSRVKVRTEQLSFANQELKDREEQMQHLLSNLSGMVYRCKNDENWSMLYISEAAITLTGYRPDELMGNKVIAFADLIDDRDKEYVSKRVEEAIHTKKHFTIEYRINTKSGETKWVWEQGLALYDDNGEIAYLDGIISDISDKKALEHDQQKLAVGVHQTDDLVILTDISGEIEYVNPAFEKVTGYEFEEVIGKNPRILKSNKMGSEFYTEMWQTLGTGEVWRGRIINQRKDGTNYIAEVSITPVRDNKGALINYVGLQRDITHEITLENNLRQAQKLEAIGTLAGGIAHEINTPTQFVASNLDFFQESHHDIKAFLDACTTLCETDSNQNERVKKLKDLQEKHDIEYLLDEIPLALRQSLDGVQQISEIVRSMKQFAHPGEENKVLVNINDAITNTVTVCRNEWKYAADIDFKLDQQLPEVLCHQSEINQVILNVVVNAAHAIELNKSPNDSKGLISITTKQENSVIEIAIEDNGGGIKQSLKERIFEPFFTTKAPGKGTGQGLAIAYSIINEKHEGELLVESEEGKGTIFFIRLPIHNS